MIRHLNCKKSAVTRMGLVHGTLSLRNPRRLEIGPVETSALVDTGSLFLCIPEWICTHLQLQVLELRSATLADGSKKNVPFVGPLQIQCHGRTSFGGALVMGNEVLLGALPMEEMHLIVVPRTQTLELNPVPIRL
jgi:clan AA aspartic protease